MQGHDKCLKCKRPKSLYPWKKVSEELPYQDPEGVQVLAWFVNELFPEGDMSFMTYLDDKFLAVNEEGEIEDYTEEVTNWMYQPERPRE